MWTSVDLLPPCRTKDRPNALVAGTVPGVLENFQRANETLERIQKVGDTCLGFGGYGLGVFFSPMA
jgi:hypothetical protein